MSAPSNIRRAEESGCRLRSTAPHVLFVTPKAYEVSFEHFNWQQDPIHQQIFQDLTKPLELEEINKHSKFHITYEGDANNATTQQRGIAIKMEHH